MQTLTVKRSKDYLRLELVFLGFGLLMSAAVALAAPKDDSLWMSLGFIPLGAFPAFFLIPYRWVRVEIDARGITSFRPLRPTRRYSWDEITSAEIDARTVFCPCIIKSNGRTIAKIPRKFDGYEQMISLLSRRGLLKDDDSLRRARHWVTLSKAKPRDLFRG